ncbi:hypothetical protein [Enterobacter hormaechei]|nr:hypothetical protein J3S84_09080 [Enterobacter cloacae]
MSSLPTGENIKAIEKLISDASEVIAKRERSVRRKRRLSTVWQILKFLRG